MPSPDQLSVPFVPGDFVRLASMPEWGCGQVQSVAAGRVTVNFEHRGKVVLDAALTDLEYSQPSEE